MRRRRVRRLARSTHDFSFLLCKDVSRIYDLPAAAAWNEYPERVRPKSKVENFFPKFFSQDAREAEKSASASSAAKNPKLKIFFPIFFHRARGRAKNQPPRRRPPKIKKLKIIFHFFFHRMRGMLKNCPPCRRARDQHAAHPTLRVYIKTFRGCQMFVFRR